MLPVNCQNTPLAGKSVPDQSPLLRRKPPNISVRQHLPYEERLPPSSCHSEGGSPDEIGTTEESHTGQAQGRI
jgi:hypothetical protein